MAKLEGEIYRLAAEALSQQEQALAELRVRTGTLLTAASLIASFLGGQALDRVGLSVLISLALVAFGISISLCIFVLLPRDGLRFALDEPEIFTALFGVRDSDDEVTRLLARLLHSFREENHRIVNRLNGAFELAGFSLLIEIILLSAALAVS